MKLVEKPWGFELIWAQTKDYVAKMLHINANERLSLQYHNIKEETVYVMDGTLLNYTDSTSPPVKIPVGQSLIIIGRKHNVKQYTSPIRLDQPHNSHGFKLLGTSGDN